MLADSSKCGLQRPQCAQCVHSNRVCTGYQRRTVFIVNQEHDLHRSSSKAARDGSNYDSPVSCDKRQIDTDQVIAPAWKKIKRVKTVSLIPAYRDQLLDTFIRGYVPLGQFEEADRRSWLHELAMVAEKPPVLVTSMLCMSMSWLGKAQGDESLRHTALSLYTKGLKELQQSLWDPQQMYSDATLAACLLLGIYELYACPGGDRRGYISHCSGCERLVQLRGPEAHREGLGHALFLAFRVQGICTALEVQRPTFLAEKTWIEVPWQSPAKGKPAASKTIADRIWDNIALAPGIFSITNKFNKMSPVEIISNALNIIDLSWEMDEELLSLYNSLECSIPGPLYWPKLSTTPNPADNEVDGKVFPVAFEFINLKTAMTCMLYWSTITMLYSGFVSLYGVLQQIPFTREFALESKHAHPLLLEAMPECGDTCICNGHGCLTTIDVRKLRPLGIRADVATPARNVMQSVEYCTKPEMLDYGASSVINPLAIVVDTIAHYDHCRKEVEWGNHVLRRSEELVPYLKHVRTAKEQGLLRNKG